MIAKVITERKIDRVFDYLVPDFLKGLVQVGHRVRIALGKSFCTGYVVQICESAETTCELKPITSLIDDEPLLTPELVKLASWVAEYYIAPIESVITAMLPPLLRGVGKGPKGSSHVRIKQSTSDFSNFQALTASERHCLELFDQQHEFTLKELSTRFKIPRATIRSLVKKRLVEIYNKTDERNIPSPEYLPSQPLRLGEEQAAAFSKILQSFNENPPRPRVLFGVTGSGKTEVYLQVIESVLTRGYAAIVLVPEIALTPQTIGRFRSRFEHLGYTIAVLHSVLTDSERSEQWNKIRRGNAQIVIGTRSAVFAPVQRLGVIIVDEEHDTSYKQAEQPRYHARDVAVVRAAMQKAAIVLGSATPSLESLHNCEQGKYELIRLTHRVDFSVLPKIHLVDMRFEKRTHGPAIFSRRMIEAISSRLEKREQVILFLNRRGFAPVVNCAACGQVIQCQHCSVSMVYHRQKDVLICHLCGHRMPMPEKCSECGSPELMQTGFGTERAERTLRHIFPKAVIQRVDSDSLRGKDAHLRVFEDFRCGRTDILLGTQMIAKGLHFPNVTLVGVLNADTALNLPDFRAGERVYQLITQVAGRAGRGDLPGEVIVQTHTPHHTAIQCARKQDWQTFYEAERENRASLGYPPFSRSVLLTVRAKDEQRASVQAGSLYESLISFLPKMCDVGQPAPAPIAKLKDYYRWQIFLKYPRGLMIQKYLRPIVMNFARQRDTSLQCDVDPYFLM